MAYTATTQKRVRSAFDTVATTAPFLRLVGSPSVQRLVFSSGAQHLQRTVASVMSLPPINRITALAPIKLARNCLDKLATAAVPKERKHNIVIVGIRSGDTFHLLRRHPNDPYEANRLDNVVGHVDEGETYERTAHREIREETSLPSEKMVGEGAATLYDLGSFLWPMTLRTPKGTEPSFVRGRMYVLYASEVDAKCIKLNPDEHVEVVSMSMPEIHKWFGELCVFDQFYFSVNGQRLTAMPLRK